MKAGLIYDTERNGKELVDNDEFILHPDKEVISYRVKIHDDSKIRFKLRLTGDAIDGDYIQLLSVRVIASKLTFIYRIFLLIVYMILVDVILWGYIRYYLKWEVERKTVFLGLTLTAFFVSLPLFHSGLNEGADLAFHLTRMEGIYRAMQASGRGESSSLSGYSLVGWMGTVMRYPSSTAILLCIFRHCYGWLGFLWRKPTRHTWEVSTLRQCLSPFMRSEG